MNKKTAKNSYLVVVFLVLTVLAVSAYVFTRYLEEQGKQVPGISTYLSSQENQASTEEKSAALLAPTTEVEPTQAMVSASSSTDILQRISQSINDPDLTEENYYDFSRGQLEDISLEEFELYVTLLRDMIGQEVETFSTMSFSERRSTSLSMLSHDSSYQEFLGNASFHWFEYTKEGVLERIPIILSQNEDGQVYLSREWVRSSLELKNFSSLYFGAIQDQNQEALERLMYSDDEDSVIIDAKTKALLKYYEENVAFSSIPEEYIVSLRMDQIQFRIPMAGEFFDVNQEVRLEDYLPVQNHSSQFTDFSQESTTHTTSTTEALLTDPSELATNVENETLASNEGEAAEEEVKEKGNTIAARENEAVEESSPEATTETELSIPSTSEVDQSLSTRIEDSSTSPDQSIHNQQYHLLTIYKRENNFVVLDVIPSDTWKKEAIVTEGQEIAPVQLGNQYTMDSLIEEFSLPQKQMKIEFEGSEEADFDFYSLSYQDFDIVLSKPKTEQEIESYTVEMVKLKTERYAVSQDYQVGERLRDLYNHYLYIDTMEYRYSTVDSSQVQVLMQEGEVKEVQLATLNYRTSFVINDELTLVEIDYFKKTEEEILEASSTLTEQDDEGSSASTSHTEERSESETSSSLAKEDETE